MTNASPKDKASSVFDVNPRLDVQHSSPAHPAGNAPSNAPNSAQEAPVPELNSKMVGGGEEMRDHDFPTPNQAGHASDFGRQLDTGKPESHETRGGGKHGEMPGDEQKVGSVGNIMDQDLVEPDFAQQTG